MTVAYFYLRIGRVYLLDDAVPRNDRGSNLEGDPVFSNLRLLLTTA
jgi:hypothetical protein